MVAFDRMVASLPGKERVARSFGIPIRIHATGAETGGAIGIWDSYLEPGGGPHWHTHTRETEAFRVISGDFRFWCGDQVLEGGPGTTVTLPPNVPHRWENIGTTHGQMIGIVSPGGFEAFFIELERTGANTAAEVLAIETGFGIVQSGLADVVAGRGDGRS